MQNDNQNWSNQYNRFNEDWEQERYRFNDEGKRRYIQDHGWQGNAGYEDRYSEGAMFRNDDRRSGSFYNREGRERPIAGTGYSAGSDTGNYGNDFNPGGYVRGSQGGSFGRSLGYNPYDDQEHPHRRNMNAANYNQGNQYSGDRGQVMGGGGVGNGYRSSYAGGYGATGNTYVDSRMGEGRNYNSDRNWWDRAKEQVSSWLGDDNKDSYKGMNEQRMGVNRGKGPRGYSRSAERIREEVCDRLAEDSWLDASDIEVQIQGDEVVLSGSVHSREDKRRAEDLVESVSGVRNVENRIRIGRSEDTISGNTSSNRTTGTETLGSDRSMNR
ncbi:MAG TPA: BON domain-containing protein [Flavisolibacter sp.]|nr:BON domain-containing protein [Flavisolibacter sp.]